MFPSPYQSQSYVEDVRQQSKAANAQTGSLVGGLLGAIGGAFLGNPIAGASLGSAAGSAIGGRFEDKEAVGNAQNMTNQMSAMQQADATFGLDAQFAENRDDFYRNLAANRRQNVIPNIDYLKFM